MFQNNTDPNMVMM